MAEQQGSSSDDRPSFATFWKNSQNELTAKELIFVQSAPGQPSNKGTRVLPLRAIKSLLIASISCSAVTCLYRTGVLGMALCVISQPRSGQEDLSQQAPAPASYPCRGIRSENHAWVTLTPFGTALAFLSLLRRMFGNFLSHTLIQARLPAVEKNGDSEQTAKNKRRAQVRKAQVQHRQRKANYVKQLEANITGIRDKTADAERERQVLRSENEAIRAQLSASAHLDQAVVPGFDVTSVPPYLPGLDGDVPIQGFDINPSFDMNFSMSPGMDAYMSTTTIFDNLEVSPRAHSGAGSSVYGSPPFMDSSDHSSPYPNIPDMATDQSQQAMDLFLARVGELENRFDGIQPQYAPIDGIDGLLTGRDHAQSNSWRHRSEHFEG